MKKIKRGIFIPSLLAILFLHSFHSKAQSTDAELNATILHLDSLFWKAYNSCDTAGMRKYLAADLEFYHDKGGITKGVNDLIAVTSKNLCRPGFKIRREAVPGTAIVYPMHNSNVLYAAILSGEHYFYTSENNQPEQRVGHARYTHLWIKSADGWTMSRIFSFDHKAAGEVR